MLQKIKKALQFILINLAAFILLVLELLSKVLMILFGALNSVFQFMEQELTAAVKKLLTPKKKNERTERLEELKRKVKEEKKK